MKGHNVENPVDPDIPLIVLQPSLSSLTATKQRAQEGPKEGQFYLQVQFDSACLEPNGFSKSQT